MRLDDPTALLRCACFNVRSAARAATAFYDKKLAPTGLRITQFALLAAIQAAGTASMHGLAAGLHLDPSTLTRTLQPLVDKGLLRIEAGEDRRRKEAVLTAAGHRAVQKAMPLWAEAQDELRAEMGGERFDRMISDLGALTAATAAD